MLHSFRLQPYLQTLDRLEMFAMDKHSSLLPKSVNYGQKSFTTLGPARAECAKAIWVLLATEMFSHLNLIYLGQGVLTEGKGSVQLTSLY